MICEEKFSGERFDEKNAASKPTGQKNHRNSNLQRLAYLKKVCTSRSYIYIENKP